MILQKIRYFIAGGWNTFFGYAVSVLLYKFFIDRFNVVQISIISNIIAISMAFLVYKLFVFKLKGNWIKEYCRSYVVYGGSAVIGIGLLWLLVDGFRIPFWIAQGLVTAITVAVSYVSHERFTFRQR